MLENLLTSGFKFSEDEYELKLKYKFFNSLLYLDAIIVFLAGFGRLAEGNIPQFSVDMAYAFLAVVTIVLVRKYKEKFQIFVKFVMFFSFIIVAFSFYFNANGVVGGSWFIIQLIVTIFLTDRKFSYFVLCVSLITIASITYLHQDKGYTILSTIFASIPIMVAFVFLLFYEKRNNDSQALLLNKNNRLHELTNNLQQLVDEEILKNKKQSEILARQAQSAAMGEMMDAIAHQWMQPLSVIVMNMQSLVLKQDFEERVSKEDIDFTYEEINAQVEHLSTTINEFRGFFRPNQKLVEMKIVDIIDSTLLLMKDILEKFSIKIEIIGDKEATLFCMPNEIKHIFINMINNSKDAFVEKNIKNRKIIFELLEDKTNTTIKISDNGGGIPEGIIKDIFNSNFTTKTEGKGTGIGLYLTKQIIQKLHGSIGASNIEDGVSFTFTIEKNWV